MWAPLDNDIVYRQGEPTKYQIFVLQARMENSISVFCHSEQRKQNINKEVHETIQLPLLSISFLHLLLPLLLKCQTLRPFAFL